MFKTAGDDAGPAGVCYCKAIFCIIWAFSAMGIDLGRGKVILVTKRCSASNYALYYGKDEMTSYYGFADTGLEIKFGSVPQGTRNPVYRGPYTLDLSDKTNIPENALVKGFYMTAEGTGGNYGSFYMQLYAPDGKEYEQLGGIEKFNIPIGKYYVRRKWHIGGSVRYSNYFTWTPRIQVVYTYEVTPSTMYYVPLG